MTPPSTFLKVKKASLVPSTCFYFVCILTEMQKRHLINLKVSAFLQVFFNFVRRITGLFGCPFYQYCCHFPQATRNSSNESWKCVAVAMPTQVLLHASQHRRWPETLSGISQYVSQGSSPWPTHHIFASPWLHGNLYPAWPMAIHLDFSVHLED